MLKISIIFCVLLSVHFVTEPKQVPVTLWEDVKVQVGSVGEHYFDRSIMVFPYDEKQKAPTFLSFQSIEGNATHQSLVNGYDVLFIKGHLQTDLIIDLQPEVVIAGDVFENTLINANGIATIFIGGDFNGTIRSSGTIKLVVQGDFNGTLVTGHPSASIHVSGDLFGDIQTPQNKGALLYISVEGQITKQKVDEIFDSNFTKAEIRTRHSDMVKGIYRQPEKNGLLVVKH
ncbi:hypothetical protein [Glaciecola petra]|uniref:Auto-transporter adhesin head GIN domain-containing protein n=1 Tax=Glaciecola petra TaxID=3075602 RepID=A0ABU2ZLM5_9ALTE|nr:hypothetical protein [Aestuariibacter sp. P117]MDT0593300.1 hypothetical protein [Aestuariibacter sp. P117]